MALKLKENSKMVYEYVRDHENENITANDIADAIGLTSRQVNGIIKRAFQEHKNEDKEKVPLMVRVPGDLTTDAAGKPKQLKYIHLTEEGKQIEIEEAE